jgi:glycerophosphoryl diester phosphodiesterase
MKLLASENGFIHVCGHRGHSIGAPENTLASVRATLELGGTTCEIDTVLSSDGEVMVIHDISIDRTTDGTGPVGGYTARELARFDAGIWFAPAFEGEPIPTLEHVLAFARGRLGLVVELKDSRRTEELVRSIGEVLERLDAFDDVVVISFDHPSLLRAKELVPRLRTEGIVHARFADPVAVATSARLDSISIELDMFHADDARRLHDAGVAIRCHLPRPDVLERFKTHGLDFEPEFGAWLGQGLIDCVSGDDVAFLRALVDRHAPAIGRHSSDLSTRQHGHSTTRRAEDAGTP